MDQNRAGRGKCADGEWNEGGDVRNLGQGMGTIAGVRRVGKGCKVKVNRRGLGSLKRLSVFAA